MVLECNNISFSYQDNGSKKDSIVLEKFSMKVSDGSFISLIGPSGCGKTTLANIIAGYSKPKNGKVVFGGKIINQPNREIFLINQENDLFEWMTVRENISFISKERADELIELVHLKGFESKYPRELSGGMKKRVAIARALALDSKVIIMDEPFGSLDFTLREKLYADILNIWQVTKKTIILITHDVSEAILLSDKVFLLSKNPMMIKESIDIKFKRPRKRTLLYTKDGLLLQKRLGCAEQD